MMELNTLKNFATDALKQSGEIADKYFNTLNSSNIELKGDNSPVTLADKEIEKFLRSRIIDKFPECGIIGEEFPDHNPNADVKFIIDPIDGTKAFIKGIPSFGIMIATMENNSPSFSAIYQPISKELWLGNCNNSEANSTPISTNNNTNLEEATLATTGFEYLNSDGKNKFDTLATRCKNTKIGGDCYNYCKLAEGKIDIVLEQGLKLYDYAPLIPILKGSNAIISDFSGQEITDFTQYVMPEFLVCSNQEIMKQAIKAIEQAS